MKDKLHIIWEGILPSNPVLVLLLGMCATLGTTSSATNGMMMGVATAAVMICSNSVISMIKSLVPDKVRIPVFIVVIATFVTLLQLAIRAWAPALEQSLGLFIPLIVVNCILLGRAEAFASRHSVFDSALDGLGCGIGFTLALTLLGGIRELLGSGSLFGQSIYSEDFGMLVFVLAPGAFIALGYMIAAVNVLLRKLSH